MAPTGAKKSEDKGVAEVVSDLWQLVRDYAKQETVDPLRAVKQLFMFGIGGAVLVALGLVFLTLAVLRGLQTETGAHLGGHLTWVPYLAALVVDLLFVAWAARAITKPFRAEEKAA